MKTVRRTVHRLRVGDRVLVMPRGYSPETWHLVRPSDLHPRNRTMAYLVASEAKVQRIRHYSFGGRVVDLDGGRTIWDCRANSAALVVVER